MLTIAFGTWPLIGLFVGGWAQNNHRPESFFTLWHGLFYSGFTVTRDQPVARRLLVSPSLRGFLPPLLSATMLTATVAFFHMHEPVPSGRRTPW